MHNGSAVSLFGTIFVDDIEQNHAVLVYWSVVLNQYIKFANSPYNYSNLSLSLSQSVGAPKLRAREWVLKTQKHMQMWYILSDIPAGMSIIIINSRNPTPKFNFCSVFSAKNPTVNDASVTMLSVRNCSRTTTVRYMFPSCFFSLSNPW